MIFQLPHAEYIKKIQIDGDLLVVTTTGGKEIKTFIRLISVLLVRSVERAERIYQAMLSRGFRGEIRVLKIHRLRLQDVFFAVFSVIIFYIFRNFNIVSFIGENIRSSFR